MSNHKKWGGKGNGEEERSVKTKTKILHLNSTDDTVGPEHTHQHVIDTFSG